MRAQRGFTILEIVVSTSLMAMVSGVLVNTLRVSQQAWQMQQSHLSAFQELRRGMDAMSRVVVSSRMDQLSIPADDNWYAGLTFRVPEDRDGDGSVLDAADAVEWSDPILYSVRGFNGTQLMRTQTGASDRVLANDVIGLRFRRQSATPSVVEIEMTVFWRNTVGSTQSSTLRSRVQLRN